MNRMLYVGTFLDTGHNRSYCADLADRLESRGWDVTRTSPSPTRARRLTDMLGTAWRRRRTYAVALIDVFSGPAFAWAELVALELRALRKPFVLTLHGGRLPEFAAAWPRRVRRLLRSANAVTSPSGYLRDRMASHLDGIRVLPNAVDTSAYAFAPRDALRPRLVWVRAFHAIYNPVLAVEVLARVPGATLTMVGPDKQDGARAATEERARALGVADRLTLVGGVPASQVARYLADADVFINTSDVDNTPLSVLEAMASGLCVVSTNVGGLPYLVGDERSGLLVAPRDAVAMSAAVQRVLGDPALASRLSRGAHARAQEHDWATVLDTWEHVLEAAAHG